MRIFIFLVFATIARFTRLHKQPYAISYIRFTRLVFVSFSHGEFAHSRMHMPRHPAHDHPLHVLTDTDRPHTQLTCRTSVERMVEP